MRDVRPLSLFTHGRYLRKPIDGFSRGALLREMLRLPMKAQPHGPRATEREFASYLKFTVVRNPWARVYSWYRNMMSDPLHGVPPCDFATFLSEHENNWALRPQTHWMIDFDGSNPLDRIIRFERLADEMPALLADLGIPDRTLPHLVPGPGGTDYRAAYSDDLAELIGKRYREEIEQFEYRFDAVEVGGAA